VREPAIETVGLSKAYRTGWLSPPHPALHPVDLAVERGECFAVLGHNGAGKTTLAHLLAGLLRPTTGEARVLGRPATDPRARAALGFMPERPALPARMRPHELLDLCARLQGMPSADARKRADELVGALALERHVDRPIGWLSAGTKQRLTLAQALLHRPEVLLLDEPLTGLDPASKRTVLHLLREARSAGATLFVSTHHFAEWSAVCDRVAVMSRGRLRVLGRTREVLESLAVRVQFAVPDGASVTRGEPVWAPAGLQARQVPPDQRDAMLRDVLAAGGEVLRIEPVAEQLLDQDDPDSLFGGAVA
jgi:ABC-2 type transport system ATP-binding protein